MTMDSLPVIKAFTFNNQLFSRFEEIPYADELWPVVYILNDHTTGSNDKKAYVGETTDLSARMNAHLNSDAKRGLKEAHFITSSYFNKSVTLDIESRLIKYLSGDGKFQLINANIGLANHNYYQKDRYQRFFHYIWDQLRAKGIARHDLKTIDNLNLFKYSPYKSLVAEQRQSIIDMLTALLDRKCHAVLMEGGAGTGKTILAVYLFKLLNTQMEDLSFAEFGREEAKIVELVKEIKERLPNPQMALVVPMDAFRKTLKRVFKSIHGLKSSMVIGPAEVAENKFDIIVVDEAHRLRRRETLGPYFNSFDKASAKLGLDKYQHTELDWVLQQSNKTILFYDKYQSIKPSDVKKEDFTKLKSERRSVTHRLTAQLRVKGGRAYVSFLKKLLTCNLKNDAIYKTEKYELLLFDSIEAMVHQIKQRNDEYGLSRLAAGYAWRWVSKKDRTKTDIDIENVQLQWNSAKGDWINSVNAINEVGCIHTTQGYDLNYVGVIFGKEISYDEKKKEIVIFKNNYHDRSGKTGIKDEDELKEFIINIYETLMLRAIQGAYIYVCDEKLRDYFAKHVQRFGQQPIKAAKPMEQITDENVLWAPLYNLQAAAGAFSKEQQVDSTNTVPLPSKYKSTEGLFACTVIGESMNKIIPNGSVCLFKRYTGGSRNGEIVLVELTDRQDPDSGSCYTVKEYHSVRTITDEGWRHTAITLKPVTNAEGYEDIELTDEETKKLRIIGIFEQVL